MLAVKRVVDIRNRPRIPIPDEDPYSVAGSGGSSGSSSGARESAQLQQPQSLVSQPHKLGRRSDKPPKLPPRDNTPYPHDIPKVGPAGPAGPPRHGDGYGYGTASTASLASRRRSLPQIFITKVVDIFVYSATRVPATRVCLYIRSAKGRRCASFRMVGWT